MCRIFTELPRKINNLEPLEPDEFLDIIGLYNEVPRNSKLHQREFRYIRCLCRGYEMQPHNFKDSLLKVIDQLIDIDEKELLPPVYQEYESTKDRIPRSIARTRYRIDKAIEEEFPILIIKLGIKLRKWGILD